MASPSKSSTKAVSSTTTPARAGMPPPLRADPFEDPSQLEADRIYDVISGMTSPSGQDNSTGSSQEAAERIYDAAYTPDIPLSSSREEVSNQQSQSSIRVLETFSQDPTSLA